MVFLLLATPLIAQDDTATQRLTEQSKQFDEKVVQVADNVYTAVGFSVSNVSMIIGNDGVVIVDTGMMLDDAGRIATAFRKHSDQPVKAIIFTHSHGDHTGGAAAFLGKERPQIWAPVLGAREVKQVLNDYRDAVQFIHDKTVEGMNKGLTPDELVEYVQLPEKLASKDYLQPFYGHPEWGVRRTRVQLWMLQSR
jgi:alkyl sulfatase BDS1-like metallo-beta-lactamase superfamily hydrolase